jgi:protein phosphatase
VIEFGLKSDIGLVREENQDTAGVFPQDQSDDNVFPGLLFVVADGMGGHRGGREASSIAVRTISDVFYSGEQASIIERLKNAFDEANIAVREFGQSHPEHRGLGTTLTALAVHKGNMYVAHVGDSRAYRVSGETIVQLTEDHSIVQEWLRKGWITGEQARTHPERSLLYRALGVGADVVVDIVEGIEHESGDRFVLCSDGLTTHVEEEEIREIVSSRDPGEACDALVDLALERGGVDNVTVLVMRVDTDSRS